MRSAHTASWLEKTRHERTGCIIAISAAEFAREKIEGETRRSGDKEIGLPHECRLPHEWWARGDCLLVSPSPCLPVCLQCPSAGSPRIDFNSASFSSSCSAVLVS